MKTNRPNLLFVMTDQHRADALGCMGNEVIQTPHIDRLASDGVLFENAFCQSPVCMASRASLITGRYPGAASVRGMGILPPADTTLPEWLRRQGYRTGAFGKLHLTPQKYALHELGADAPILDWRRYAEDAAISPIPDDPLKENYGFEEHVGCDDALLGEHHRWLEKRAPHLAAIPRRPKRDPDGPGDLHVSPYPAEYHPTTFIATQAQAFIEKQKPDTPWMAHCSFIAPHHPFEAPEEVIARYRPEEIPLPRRKGGACLDHPPERVKSAIDEIDRYSEAIQRRIVHHYYASISLIDDAVGALRQTLEATGQSENTIIVFVSDHGEMLGEHGLLRKPSVHFDDLLRVPLIVAAPGVASRTVSGLVELVDIYPTLMGLLDLPLNPGVQGIDWSSGMRAGTRIGRTDIYSEMFDLDPMVCESAGGPYTSVRTIRTEEWKLNIYPTDTLEASQLFHLSDDPDETVNRFHDPECREKREELLFRLIARVHADVDPLPLRLRQY